MDTLEPSGEWPFDEPKNLAVITTKSIMREGKPVLYVFHTEEEEWSFMDGEPPKVENGMVVGLSTMMQHDSSLLELANLPPGWVAWRESRNAVWKREQYEEAGEDD